MSRWTSSPRQFFESLAYSHRKEWVRWIEEAKKPETRTVRLVRTVDALARAETAVERRRVTWSGVVRASANRAAGPVAAARARRVSAEPAREHLRGRYRRVVP